MSELALERLSNVGQRLLDIQTEEAAARAEYVRCRLVEIADSEPAINGFSFDVEYEYNDEGGYFPVASIYPSWASAIGELTMEIEDELIEIGNELSELAIELHLGESKTIKQLREVKF